MTARIVKLPAQVAAIYRIVEELEREYPGRKFTPDGHLVGSLGEVVAAKELGLKLYPPGHATHDARDEARGCDVQIKMTAGKSVSLYDCCDRLIILRVINPEEAEIAYEGDGKPAWDCAGKKGKNGQRRVSLAKLQGKMEKVSS